MAQMISEVYDALRSVNVSEEKARKAAEAMASDDPRLAKLETKIDVLTWMVGFNLALTLAVPARLLFIR